MYAILWHSYGVVVQAKLILNSGLVQEINIEQVPNSSLFPDGIKYRLILEEPVWKKVLVYYDNNSPFVFKSTELLIKDFLNRVQIEEKRYENNEN
jgi:hypothetical protein